jgi:hypothetical protein
MWIGLLGSLFYFCLAFSVVLRSRGSQKLTATTTASTVLKYDAKSGAVAVNGENYERVSTGN